MNRRMQSNWLLTGVLLIGALSVLLPGYFTVVTAMKAPTDMRGNLWALPDAVQWQNFVEAYAITDFPRRAINSAIVTALAVVFTVLSNSMVGYALARNMHRRFFKISFFYIVTAMFIPFPILMLPLVRQMNVLHLDNRWGLIVLYVVFGLAFNSLLYAGYMQTVPRELDEAACMDGANTWTTFWRVIFPLLTPVNATVAILTALWAWNDFLLPLVLLSDTAEYTLPLAQHAFQNSFGVDYNLAFASYLLAMGPMIAIYLFAQRYIIGGVMRGAVKS